MARTADAPSNSRFVVLVSSALIITGLYFGREVLIPIALAVLLTFLLYPAVRWLERLRLPRIAATLIVVAVGVGILGCGAYFVGKQLTSIVEQFPTYEVQLRAKFRAVFQHGKFLKQAEKEVESVTSDHAPQHADDNHSEPAPRFLGMTFPGGHPGNTQGTKDNPVFVSINQVQTSTLELVRGYLTSVLGPLVTAIIVLVFVIFMLIDREELRDRIIRLLGHGQLNLTTQAIDEASTRISSYLAALALVNAGYALCSALGMWLIGKLLGHGQEFPDALTWGILVGLLRFVPYVGIWIGAGIPLLLAFALFPGNAVFFGVLTMFAILEIVVAQFIEPMWYGSSTGMSPLAVLVAAVFWTWLWGPIGLLLSTPLTVVLVVLGKYVPSLKFLDIMLRDEPVLAPPVRFYQRLVALDQEDAADIAREYLKDKKSLQMLYDDVFIPALAMAERDSQAENVADDQRVFVRQSVRDLVDEMAEVWRAAHLRSAASEANATTGRNGTAAIPAGENLHHHLPDGCKVNVLCVPARDEADEIVGLMLAQLLELRGYCVFTGSPTTLAGELLDMVESKHPDLVCVSAMAPAAVAHSRYLCKRLGTRFSDLGLVVGLWSFRGDLSKAKDRIASAAAVHVTATLGDAEREVGQLAQPLIVRSAMNESPRAEAALTT